MTERRLKNYARCLQEEEISRAVSERKRLARQLLSAENSSLTSRCTDGFHNFIASNGHRDCHYSCTWLQLPSNSGSRWVLQLWNWLFLSIYRGIHNLKLHT